MSANRRLTLWQWLLVGAPAIELMVLPLVAGRWGAFLFPRDEISGLSLLIRNLGGVFVYSIALGFWHSRSYPKWSDRLGMGVVFGFSIVCLNGMIALAGCSAGAGLFK